MKYLEVGKILTTFGIKGEVKVLSETSFQDERFKIGNKLLIKVKDKMEEITISSYRIHKNMPLITFNNITNINDVLEYVGCIIYVEKSKLRKLEDNDYYVDDLIGLKVFIETIDNEYGEVIDVLEVPQGHLLRVTDGVKKPLVPFRDEFVKTVNIEKNYIIIKPIEGLL